MLDNICTQNLNPIMTKSRQNFTSKKQHKIQYFYFCLYFCVAGIVVDCTCRVNGMKVIYIRATRATFQPKLKKYKKHTPKIFLVYSQKCFLYLLKRMFFLIFRKIELFIPKIKKYQEGTFKSQKTKKIYSEKSLIFLQKRFLPTFRDEC